VATAEKYASSIYDFFETVANNRKSYSTCREVEGALLGYKRITVERKYTVVFIETEKEIMLC
jgi:hypothetical protein